MSSNPFQNQSHLKAVMDTVLDGLIIIDERGLIQSFNPAAIKIFGYELDEVMGQNVKMLMPSSYRDEHDSYLENYHQTGTKKIIGIGREVEAKRKNGSIFPLWLGINEMSIDGKQMFVGTIRDLTERRRAEQALKDSESQLRAIVDHTVDGLITIDESGVIETFNESCEQIFGYSATEVIGENVKILMPEPFYSEHDQYLKNHRETGEKKIIGIGREVKGRRKDGSVFPLDLSVSEIQIKNRKLYSGILRDITERKKAEARIMQSNLELERFAVIASHDLQEPLRMISSFTELLDKEYGSDMDDDARLYLKFVVDASVRMQKLVSDLLEYSRINSHEADCLYFDANEQLSIVLNNLHEAIVKDNIVVTSDELPEIYSNQIQFGRLLQNLVSNAVKYRAGNRQCRIHIGCGDVDGSWQFFVRDNGIGIEEEYIDQIFTIFRRLHNKDEYSGTGIGLSVCKRIIDILGGKLWVESEKDQGSTFYFTIPKPSGSEEK
ncbi:MAG: PAS domain S-box protein [Gammaproteobacteria bacterium]|nr:PAS domain S-box protein [Gammaproteobacteria bacterium]